MSNDMFLGNPLNVAEAAALMHIVGLYTGYKPRWLTVFIGDAHIYRSHVPLLEEQMKREPYAKPTLLLSPELPSYESMLLEEGTGDTAKLAQLAASRLSEFLPEHAVLVNYEHHPAIEGKMAV